MFHFTFDELRSHRKQKIDQFGEGEQNYAPFVQNTKTMLSQKVRLFGQIFNYKIAFSSADGAFQSFLCFM